MLRAATESPMTYQVESYPWNGEEVFHKRRDKRKGQHVGRAVRLKEGPSIQ